MKLLRLKTAGFGALRGEYAFDPERLTLVVDDNERGKSTLLSAIAAALYGLSDDRRSHRPLTPLERYRPWEGGAFDVELELECGGERYTITRDFARGTVAVWNDRGQDKTAEFLDGRDEYPVGQKLIGLDAEEFEKCAFVRHEELDQVVPADEKDRRANSLQARLERAADTRAGNSSAAEALRVLEEAAARYDEPLLGTTIRVENAIQRLETKVATLDSELHALEHDRAAIQPQLDRLAALEEEERAAHARDLALNAERRAALAFETHARLDRHRAARERLDALDAEVAALADCAGVPPELDGEFRQAVARIDELARQRGAAAQEAAGHEEALAMVDREIQELAAFETFTDVDADRFIAYAADLRRLEVEVTQTRSERERVERALQSRGFDRAALAQLEGRFGTLDDGARALLQGGPAAALDLQSRALATGQARATLDRTLAELKRAGGRHAIPGVVLVVLALVAGGFAYWQFRFETFLVPWEAFAGGAGVLLLLGIGLLIAAGRHGRREKLEAVAERARLDLVLATVAGERASHDARLAELARTLGAGDVAALVQSWGDWGRVAGEREPLQRLDRALEALEAERDELLGRAGHPPGATALEDAARAIRARTQRLERREPLAQRLAAAANRRDVAAEQLAAAESRAAAALARAGMAPDPTRAWADHADELTRRVRGAQRLAGLDAELIPQTRGQLLAADHVLQLEQTLALIESDLAAGASPAPAAAPLRGLAEIDRESQAVRAGLDDVRRERGDLRVRVEEVAQRVHRERPEKTLDRDACAQALERAQRFRRSIELARDTIAQVALETHRRWADFLNHRVGELVGAVGAKIEQVRFGEDLDFAVKPAAGQQVSRGKAVRQLSSGARDQLHIAVRLAISEYLSREEPLPLLIDDCFVTSDDERARLGLRMLIEQYAPAHQVVLVTCHRGRFEALAAREGELFAQRVSWTDVTSLRGVTPPGELRPSAAPATS